jgi:hypothetical protein
MLTCQSACLNEALRSLHELLATAQSDPVLRGPVAIPVGNIERAVWRCGSRRAGPRWWARSTRRGQVVDLYSGGAKADHANTGQVRRGLIARHGSRRYSPSMPRQCRPLRCRRSEPALRRTVAARQSPRRATLDVIRRAFENAGVEFIDAGSSVRLLVQRPKTCQDKGRPHDLKAFDEVSDFSESQYTFIIGWNRTTTEGHAAGWSRRAIRPPNPRACGCLLGCVARSRDQRQSDLCPLAGNRSAVDRVAGFR